MKVQMQFPIAVRQTGERTVEIETRMTDASLVEARQIGLAFPWLSDSQTDAIVDKLHETATLEAVKEGIQMRFNQPKLDL